MTEALDHDLRRLLTDLWSSTPVVSTISEGRPNRVHAVGTEGVWIETEASAEKGTGAQLVPGWMLNAAWGHLRREGTLTNKYLLSSDGLNVKRSSAVCALLAALPGVTVVSTRPICLAIAKSTEA